MSHPGQKVSIMLLGKCMEKFLIALEKNEAAVPKQNNTWLSMCLVVKVKYGAGKNSTA